MPSPSPGLLVLAATPIGDVRDASPALIEALQSADVVAAEDTRRFMAFLQRLGVTVAGRVVSYFEGNEAGRTPQLVEDLLGGATVVLVTDAGMPSISDPGYRIVNAAIEAGVRVSVVPGPSAVLAALAVSGLPVDRFCFEGFLPRKQGERARRLDDLASEQRTLVFFEAPHRLRAFLTDAAGAFGVQRRAAVCRELTKTYEEVVRGPLGELVAWAQDEVRGEITVVIEGAALGAVLPLDEAVAAVNARVAAGERLAAAAAEVAQITGVNRKELYQAVVDARATSAASSSSGSSRSEPSSRSSSSSSPWGGV